MTFVVIDACMRRSAPDGRTYLGWLGSALVWSALVAFVRETRGAKRRVLSVVVALVHAVLGVSQLFAMRYFGAPLGAQSLAAARAAWGDVARVLSELAGSLALAMACATIASYTLLWLSLSAPKNATAAGAVELDPSPALPMLSLGAVALTVGALPPDVALVSGLPALREANVVTFAHTTNVPQLPSNRARLPDVLLVVTESVRDADACSLPTDTCATAPELNAFATDRIGFSQLRSLASYTTIAVGGLLTGHEQLGSHEELARMPLLFDYAKAVRGPSNARYFVAYYGAQISSSVFERGSIEGAADRKVDLEDLVGHAVEDEDQVLDALPDRLLEARFSKEVANLPHPRFIVLHLLGTHAPYAIDPEHAPFRPYRRAPSLAHMDELHNAYKNALLAQDHDLTKMLRAFSDSEGSDPWLMVYTSDHGEAFGEHGAIHHGQNLYPEQVHVPGFLLSRNGALSADALTSLREHAKAPLTHADIVPTLLDAVGVWSSMEMLPYRREMVGQSWLAPFSRARTPIAVTNCNGSFKCPLNNWGLYGERASLVAQAWDPEWRCVTLSGEGVPDPAACAELRHASHARFPKLPNGEENK